MMPVWKYLKMNRNEKLLITINTMYNLASTMASVFINVYLFVFTGSVFLMILYAMVRFMAIPLGSLTAGYLSRRFKLQVSLTGGLIIVATAMTLILSINQYFGEYPILIYMIGALYGFGEGLFWLSMNSFNFGSSSLKTRASFVAYLGIFNAGAGLLSPLISAVILQFASTDVKGYIMIFQVVVVLMILLALLSTRILPIQFKRSFTLSDKFNFKADPAWRFIAVSHALFGIRDSLILVLTGLLIYEATGGKGSLYSQLLSLFAVLMIAANSIVGRYLKKDNMTRFYLLGSILLFFSTSLLVLNSNLFGAVSFGVLNALGNPFYFNPFLIMTMNVVQRYFEHEGMYARMILREWFLGLGRIVGMLMMAVCLSVLPEPVGLILSVFVCSSFGILVAVHTHRVQKSEVLEEVPS